MQEPDVKISYEYIRGLIEGEGSFSFCKTTSRYFPERKYKLPAFQISMHERDKDLLIKVRNALELTNKVYNYKNSIKSLRKGRKAVLIVREFHQLKDIIVPLFYKKLHGHKGKQFNEWIQKIGNDPDVSDRFKSIYRLHRWGFYDKKENLQKFS